MIELIKIKKLLLRLVMIMSINLLAKNRSSLVLTVHCNANVIVLSNVGLSRLYLTIWGYFHASSVQIISLHAIEATKNEEPLIVENHSLVESTRCQWDVERDAPSPCLQLEVVLVDVVKSFEGEIDATKDIHGLLCRTCRVPVPALNISLHLPRLEPDSIVQIKNGKVVEGHLTIPAAENIHVVLIYDRSVAKSNLGLRK